MSTDPESAAAAAYAAAIAGVASDLDLPESTHKRISNEWVARAESAFHAGDRWEEASAAADIALLWLTKAQLAELDDLRRQEDTAALQESMREILEFSNTDGQVVAAAVIGDEGIVARRFPVPGGHLEFPAHLTVQQARALRDAYEEITRGS